MAKGYSLDALVQEHYAKSVFPLGTKNIDDMWGRENVGTFPQNQNALATVANGYPAGAQAGNLEILLTSAGTVDNCIQRYTNFSDLRMWIRSQDQGTGIRTWTPWRELINANNIYNAIYPIGIVLQFDNATNPNNSFTGTVWEQITDGRAVRAATSAEAGTTAGQIGSTAGSDNITIATGNLPAHSHTMAHTHTINHDHGAVTSGSNGDHAHSGTSLSAVSNGAHTHSLSGTANSNGSHSHNITVREADGSGAAIADSDGGGIARTTSTASAGSHTHSVSGTANSSGAHTHSISGNTGTTGAHTHSVDLPNFTGTSGGSSAANTGNTGSGTAISVLNASHYYALWKRVA